MAAVPLAFGETNAEFSLDASALPLAAVCVSVVCACSETQDLPRQIANANVFFNVTVTLIWIWLVGPLARYALNFYRLPP